MNIAIIGGGWVGCHLSHKLKDSHNITIYDKNIELFKETSYNNQNRLHLGFHYSRSLKTRNLCLNTFDRFIQDYSFLTKELPKNLYCVPITESLIDYGTFEEIFKGQKLNKVTTNFNRLGGCVNTDEKFIDFKQANIFFNNELKHLVICEHIDKVKIKKLKRKFDLVINFIISIFIV